MTPSECG